MTEWVKEDDWSKVKPGQSVRLESPDGALEFTTTTRRQTRDCWEIQSKIGTYYGEWDWTLFVEDTPEPVLPTEPGWYELDPAVSGIALLRKDGTWCWAGNKYNVLAEPMTADRVRTSEHCTRLEPVPVTAKRVTDWLYAQGHLTLEATVRAAREFGVTGD